MVKALSILDSGPTKLWLRVQTHSRLVFSSVMLEPLFLMTVERFDVANAEYFSMVLVQRRAESHSKRNRGKELSC